MFLSGQDLGSKIKAVLNGADIRCAVAFWGDGAVSKLFPNGNLPGDAKIVCDLTMGGTNPRELDELGAPNNDNLKHLPGLHAKIYSSDVGVVICSANASNNGIGFLHVQNLIEAGSYHGPATNTHKAALGWFDSVWRNAKTIDDSALKTATLAWKRRTVANASRTTLPANPASLFDTVIADPERFRGIGFAFTTGGATLEQRDQTAEAVNKADNFSRPESLAERQEVRQWPRGNTFSNWEPVDISRWPLCFVCVHRPRERLSYWFYERAHIAVVDGAGMLLARRVPNGKRSFGFSREITAEADTDKAAEVFSNIAETGHQLFANGAELAQFLLTLPPWSET